jgi:hypothetical protein
MATFNTCIDDEFKTAIKTAKDEIGIKTDSEFLKTLFDILPIYLAVKEKGVTIEEAIDKINSDAVTSELKVIRKGINEIEFNRWLEKLIAHNEKHSIDERVFITQNLFLDLIGGNVNSISKLYRENEQAILEHNEKMGIEKSQNRKLSSRIRSEYKNVVEWLKAKTAQ